MANKADEEDETEYVQELLRFSEVFVYRVPPLTSVQTGHRAETWGLETPFATCMMKVLAKGDTIMLQLFSTEKQGQLIAACPINLEGDQTLEYWVEQVKDSARYFVIRMVDAKSKKQALLGIGFRERNPAFEFQEALSHHFRRVMRLRGIVNKDDVDDPALKPADQADVEEEEDEDSAEKKSASVKAGIDLSLKQPIKIAIKGTKTAPPVTAPISSDPQPGFSLAPPPTKPAAEEDVEWGDFEG